MLMVNQDCIKCGICAETCPARIIEMGQDGPRLLYPTACIKCGHCVAVCPQECLDHEKVPLSKQVSRENYPVLDPQTAAHFLRARRSIRNYKNEAVPKEKMLQLLDVARFAPSGGNSQGLSYIVVTEQALLKQLTELTVRWMEEQLTTGLAWARYYEGVVQSYRKTGRDIILRGAPALIIATAPKNFRWGHDNTRYSLAYAELYAPTLGLGSCWAGYFEICAASGYPEIYKLLGIEEDLTVTGAIMVGCPAYHYHRLVDRNPLQVTWK
ncbi:nitroreductase family protein [Desulforamulus aeronauticus]|uniref:Nitroreductase n=1 Tax=Desulforamulus aeronauticus DSM 10349 TaxID=1121421 RepID=A0A1M6TES1_9FIRM|nr:nitroreductase family protein [Desulforamulus aeronauticus]SHK55374.1 Nitroreductase [Desulforamulus aeronauticus DSM 10349]